MIEASKSQKASSGVRSAGSGMSGIKPARKRLNTLLAVPWDLQAGGVMSVLDHLARYLLAHGHDVLFFHPGHKLMAERRVTMLGFPGVRVRLNMPIGPKERRILRVLAFPFFLAVGLLQLAWVIRKRHIRIVNLHYPEDNFFYFALCRYLLPIRLVTSLHGGDVVDDYGRPRDSFSRAFRFILHASDLIILPSETYRKKVVAVFPFVKHKTIAIHNGINPARFSGSASGRNGAGPDQYILCVAELRPYKGIDVLLRAFKLLLAKEKSLRLVLAGDGPLREELESLAASLGVDGHTDFLGTQTAADVVRLLHGAAVFVLPSRADNCPIALLEAMMCKKAIVASAVGGIPELIEQEKSGILVEPENHEALAVSLLRLLKNDELKRRLAEAAHFRAMEHFCFDRTGEEYETALASLFQ
jgi:glycosyltransferase involved in cell wall biosynthesis